MTVWVVLVTYDYDAGAQLWGVFTSEAAAKGAASAKFAGPMAPHWEVDAYTLDQPGS